MFTISEQIEELEIWCAGLEIKLPEYTMREKLNRAQEARKFLRTAREFMKQAREVLEEHE